MVEIVDKLGYYSHKKVRKHVTQMSSSEKDLIRRRFKAVKNWEITDHVNDRIVEKNYSITTDDFLDLMKNGEIVEYEQKLFFNANKLSELVVLKHVRDRGGIKDKLHLVFDLSDNRIVTVWINSYDDNHDTLDMGIYSKGLKVGESYWQN